MKRLGLCRLSRGGRTVRNLLLVALLALAIWTALDCPLPRILQVRRIERLNLLPPSQIVYEDSQNRVVGLGEDLVLSVTLDEAGREDWKWTLRRYPLEGGCQMIPMSGRYGSRAALLGLNVPRAARAELELDLSWREEPLRLRVEGLPRSGGIWLFELEEFWEQARWEVRFAFADGCSRTPWVLRLYDDRGALLQTLEGITPLGTPNEEVDHYIRAELSPNS